MSEIINSSDIATGSERPNLSTANNRIIFVKKSTQIQRMSKKRDNWSCRICLEKAEKDTDWYSLDCSCEEMQSVQYHKNCISKWLSKHDFCPTCKTDVTYSPPPETSMSNYYALEKPVQSKVIQYQEYLRANFSSLASYYPSLVRNKFERDFLKTHSAAFLCERLKELCKLSNTVKQDLWMATVENCVEALISCDIAESFKHSLMMHELWSRVYRNYKKCFDSLWENLLDFVHTDDSEQLSSSVSNSKFRDYVMKFSFYYEAPMMQVKSSPGEVAVSVAYIAEREACEKFSKLEDQKIQNHLISPDQVEEAREAAKGAL